MYVYKKIKIARKIIFAVGYIKLSAGKLNSQKAMTWKICKN